MQLNDRVEDFAAIGVNVVAISYDPHVQNATFAQEQGLRYPILSDQEAATVQEFGILNEDYEAGHPAYGVPHPGVIFVTPAATIGLKRAISGYKERPDFDELLAAVSDAPKSG